MMHDRRQLDLVAFGAQKHGGSRHRQFTDGALLEPAAHNDAFGVFPRRLAQIFFQHINKFCGKFIDRSDDQSRRLFIIALQQSVERLLAQLRCRCVAEGIVATLADALAPVFELFLKSGLACPVADEAILVAQLVVVFVNDDRGQILRAMDERGAVRDLLRGLCLRHPYRPLSQ